MGLAGVRPIIPGCAYWLGTSGVEADQASAKLYGPPRQMSPYCPNFYQVISTASPRNCGPAASTGWSEQTRPTTPAWSSLRMCLWKQVPLPARYFRSTGAMYGSLLRRCLLSVSTVRCGERAFRSWCPHSGMSLSVRPHSSQASVVVGPNGFETAAVASTIQQLRQRLPGTAAVAIDIPIGLSEHGSRKCDKTARDFVGPRRNSVFMTPPRRALELEPYEATWTGMWQRIGLLESVGIAIPRELGSLADGTPSEDLLDAAAAAWSAWRILVGTSKSVSEPESGIDGRLLAIWY